VTMTGNSQEKGLLDHYFSGILVVYASIVDPTQTSKPSDSSDKNRPEDSRPGGTIWAYASEGTQLAVTLLLGIYLGYKLDQWKGTLPWFTLAGAFSGLSIGLYNFLRRFLKK